MLIRLLSIALFAILASGCSARTSVAPQVSVEQQAAASRAMGLSFPPETKFLFYHRESDHPGLLPAPDDMMYLKIELPASALPKLLAQAPLSSGEWSSTRPEIYDMPNRPEWRPSQIKKYRSRQFRLPDAEGLNALIDEDQEATKVVYLMWFET